MKPFFRILPGLALGTLLTAGLYYAIHKSIETADRREASIKAATDAELAATHTQMKALSDNMLAEKAAAVATAEAAYQQTPAARELERLHQEDLKALAAPAPSPAR
jgi:hypothetical protein